MEVTDPDQRVDAVRRIASRLKYPKLLILVTALFVLDFITPDPIPFFDEIFMGMLAGLLAMWKERREGRSIINVTPTPDAEKPNPEGSDPSHQE